MKFSIKFDKTVSAKVRCAACYEQFVAPHASGGGTLSGNCPKCGRHYSIRLDENTLKLFAQQEEGVSAPSSNRAGNTTLIEFTQARMKAMLINGAAVAFTVWAIVFPEPYLPVMAALVLLPLALPLLIASDRGAIRVIDYPKTGGPHIAFAFLALPMALLFRASLDFNLLSFRPLLQPAAATAVIAFALYARFAVASGRGIGPYLLIIPFLLIFGFASAITVNCVLDNSPGKGFSATVLDKRVSKGRRSNGYYLALSEWGNRKSGSELNVPGKVYRAVDKNDHVAIELKPGFLGARWYVISKV